LPHIKGRWKTPTIELEPWQCFFLTVIFGWVDGDGLRRYRKAYIEVPRKNAKTTISAGIALYLLCADGEPGAEVYSAAVTRDQAKYSWDIAQQMVKRDVEMQEYYGLEPLAHSIVIPRLGASFKPLSRDADSLEGLNPHGAVIDELHAHKTREVFDVINLATGSRHQSLVVQITTAGDNKTGVCYEQHHYIEQTLQGNHEDERYFGIIYTIDPEDDWTTAEAARKANPNYGVSVLRDDIETICRQAQLSAESQNTFLTKRLNIWVSVGTAYFNMLAWDQRCKDRTLKLENFQGYPCRIHIDLASKRDLTSKLMCFEGEDGSYAIFGKYYLPEDAIESGSQNCETYRGWAHRGFLTLTPGNITDYEFIERDVIDDMRNFIVSEVIYDPFQATYLVTRLQAAGAKMIEFPMTVQRFSGPMKEVDADVVSGKLRHNGDPVLSWMMGNVVARRDAKDNVFPRKARDENKIDAAIGVIAVRGRAIASQASKSVYETRGLLTT
jgi:phage terminase large subunit-like protein